MPDVKSPLNVGLWIYIPFLSVDRKASPERRCWEVFGFRTLCWSCTGNRHLSTCRLPESLKSLAVGGWAASVLAASKFPYRASSRLHVSQMVAEARRRVPQKSTNLVMVRCNTQASLLPGFSALVSALRHELEGPSLDMLKKPSTISTSRFTTSEPATWIIEM